jgi:nucleotide-binding universal stress UspA family protein
MTMRKILVATDFSDGSARALDLALELARADGASVMILHVCQMPAFASPNTVGMYVPTPELVADILADARRALQALKARVEGSGVPVETDFVEGEPAAEIVAYAEKHSFDLIVMGTHGRTGFRRLLLGSVAERVVRTAGRPVLTTGTRRQAETAAGAA